MPTQQATVAAAAGTRENSPSPTVSRPREILDDEFERAAAIENGLHGYMRHVAAAMHLAGNSYYLDRGPPLAAYLALGGHLPQFPGQHLGLIWNEQHGWAIITETEENTTTGCSYLGGEVLPPPEQVAAFVTVLLTGRPYGFSEPPRLRAPGADDDLPDRLTSYHRPRHF
jgi:hypothetical protein